MNISGIYSARRAPVSRRRPNFRRLPGLAEILEDRLLLSADPNSTYAALPAAALTALDNYVAAADPSYTYSLASTISGTGYTDYVINLTSQTWRSASEVDKPAWNHWLQIIVPSSVTNNTALLKITGGSNTAPIPTSADAQGVQYATSLNSVVIVLPDVPSEPLKFSDESISRSEDEIIAYTYDKFLDGGDSNWPLLLPMVKSAVRAMDTAQSFISTQYGGSLNVNDFIVTGASKRGWTTWLTPAVDNRVRAIVPFVFDALNLGEQIPHHKDVYVGVTDQIIGGYSDEIHDYTELAIFDRINTPRGAELRNIVDPYEYIDRANYFKPKYSVVGANDQFFVTDSTQFYINDLPGVNYLRIVPNAGHGLNSDALTGAINFEKAIIAGYPLPTFDWDVVDAGSTIDLTSITPADSVKLWTSVNPNNRDFRQDTFGTNWTSTALTDQGGGNYSGHVDPPANGAIAFFVEMTYLVNGIPLVFTTEARELPLFTPQVLVTHPDVPYSGSPSPASAEVLGVGGGNIAGTFNFTYYTGSTPGGPGSATPPVDPGLYTVIASFASSDRNYKNGQSAPVTFKILPGPSGIGTFRSGKFYLDTNGNGLWNGTVGGDSSFAFGLPGDKPVSGDWNGDGTTDIGIFRNGVFYLDANGNRKWDGSGGGDQRFAFGDPNGTPVSGDWNGDRITDVGVFLNGKFSLDLNANRLWDGLASGDVVLQFGTAGDIPAVGDWNGDGMSDLGVYRNGTFYIDENGNRAWNNITGGDRKVKFGTIGDKPLPGDWNGDGKTDLGVVRNGVFYLDANGNFVWDNTAGGDRRNQFGNPSDLPIEGTWKKSSTTASGSMNATEATASVPPLPRLRVSPPPRPNRTEVPPASLAGANHPLSSIPVLNSLPGAAASIYLDFNGHFEASWGSYSNITTPVYSIDGDLTTFSDAELSAITEIWKRVAEDYAPFKINVTTVQPLSFANQVAVRIAIGGLSSDWYGQEAGGVAYVDSFTDDTPNTVYVFAAESASDTRFIADASSHEAGHNFGLDHQSLYDANGTKLEEYNPGGGGWAPLMGYSYEQARSTWWNGPSSISSTSLQDDMALISRVANGFGYRTDDAGSDFATSKPLAVSGSNVSGSGIIEKPNDFDSFSFSSASGQVQFTVSPAELGPNLILRIELFTAGGSLIASAAGGVGTPAVLSRTLSAGTYQIRVASNGTYGSVGQYSIAGVLPAVVQNEAVGTFVDGTFYIDQNNNAVWNGTGGGDATVRFGTAGDRPLVGDWNGDGQTDVGVFRSGTFYLDSNGNRAWNGTSGGDSSFNFGIAGDIPVAGDWNGNGLTDVGVFREGVFYLDLNGNWSWNGTAGGDSIVRFGTSGDVPIIGDWNGDGRSDIGVYRINTFYLDANGNRAWNNTTGGDAKFVFGSSGDKPLAGDWNGDGRADIGVYRGSVFYLDSNGNRVWNNTTGGDRRFSFGSGNQTPLSGLWSSPASAQLPPARAATIDFIIPGPSPSKQISPIVEESMADLASLIYSPGRVSRSAFDREDLP